MPTFGRLGRHSNRSQQGISEQPPAAGAQSNVGAGNSGTAVGGGDAAAVGLAKPSLDTQSALSPSAGNSPLETIDIRQQQQLQQQQQQQGQGIPQNVGPNKLQKQQPQQSQGQLSQQAPAPPPHLYSAQSTSSAANNNPSPLQQQHPGGGDYVFDARQQQQQQQQQQHSSDFSDQSVNRSQSLRYPSQTSLQQQLQPPQQQQVYGGIAPGSVDDLPSPASFQQLQQPQQQPPQPAPPPEKHRTNRKLHIIKGIFGSVRGTSDTSSSSQNSSHAPAPQSANPPPYETNAGLARRPSNKRVSTQLYHALHSRPLDFPVSVSVNSL